MTIRFLNVITGKTECQFDKLPLWMCKFGEKKLIACLRLVLKVEEKSLQGQQRFDLFLLDKICKSQQSFVFRFCGLYKNRIYNNNLLHLNSAFLGTQSALHCEGISPQPPPAVSSIHLDDETAAILHQNTHHTPAYWWRGDRVMKPISGWG